MVLLLVPADPLRPRRADEHFAAEAAAASGAGHDVALIDAGLGEYEDEQWHGGQFLEKLVLAARGPGFP